MPKFDKMPIFIRFDMVSYFICEGKVTPNFVTLVICGHIYFYLILFIFKVAAVLERYFVGCIEKIGIIGIIFINNKLTASKQVLFTKTVIKLNCRMLGTYNETIDSLLYSKCLLWLALMLFKEFWRISILLLLM